MSEPRRPKAPAKTAAKKDSAASRRVRSRKMVSTQMDGLFEEARSYEYMVINLADRVEMQRCLSDQARGGWEVHTFTAMPDPGCEHGRKSIGVQDLDHMDNLGVIYVALMRRGGLLPMAKTR